MHILTHRGLDPSRKNYFLESSYEAFENQLKRGFGLEFDVQVTKNGDIIIFHDKDLERISEGTDLRKIPEITSIEFKKLVFNGCHFVTLSKLIVLIDKYAAPDIIHAIHLKHYSQKKDFLDTLITTIKNLNHKKFFIFDVTYETAKYLKEHDDKINLAPSVAHSFDIERYSGVVGGTLIPVDEILKNPQLFSWVWLDEWDRTDNNGIKDLYNKEVFQKLRDHEIKIALVSPELHATSPNLFGGELHQDATTMEKLRERLVSIIALKPDAICTDYPDMAQEIYSSQVAFRNTEQWPGF